MTLSPNPAYAKIQKTLGMTKIEEGYNQHGYPNFPSDYLERVAALEIGDKEAQALAEEAFSLWDINGRKQIDISSLNVVTPCTTMPASEIGIFTSDLSDIETEDEDERSFASDILDLSQLKARETCSACPLKMACLSSSLTIEVRDRNDEVVADEISRESFGIWGGLTPAERSRVNAKMMYVWADVDSQLEQEEVKARQESLEDIMASTEIDFSISERIYV